MSEAVHETQTISEHSAVVRQTVTTETRGWGEHARWSTTHETHHYDEGDWAVETTTHQRLSDPEAFLRTVLKPAYWPQALRPPARRAGHCDCQHCRDLAGWPTRT